MRKVSKGIYQDIFNISFRTKGATSTAKEGSIKEGLAEVKLYKNELGLWCWSLEIINSKGQVIYTENDPYPFDSKREAVEFFKDIKQNTRTFYY